MAQEQEILDEQQQEPLTDDGTPKPKPKFNPNKSFTPVAEVKPPFDPNKPVEESKKKDISESFATVSDPLQNHRKIFSGLSKDPVAINTSSVAPSESPIIENPNTSQRIKKEKEKSTSFVFPNGIELPVTPSDNYGFPAFTPQGIEPVKNIQKKIDDGKLSMFDIDNISKYTGKSKQAVAAYLKGDGSTGHAVSTVDILKKNNDDLVNIVNQYNVDFADKKNPVEILSSGEKTAKFLNEYILNLIKTDPIKAKANQMDAMGYAVDLEALANQVEADPKLKSEVERYNNLLSNSERIINELSKHVIKTTATEDYFNSVPRDVTANKIASRIDPVGYANAQKALKTQSGFNRITDKSNVFDVIGAITDEVRGGKGFKDQMLNSVVGIADLQLNNAYAEIANEKAAMAKLSNDDDLMTQAKLLYANVDKKLLNKYPALQMQQMASEIGYEIAKDAGQLEGSETQDYALKLKGTYREDLLKRIEEKGWLNDPIKKPLALRLLENPEMIQDASYFGGAKESFLQPFKDLGLSLMDLTGVRNFKDIYSDKLKDDLFPKEFNPNETKTAFTVLGHDFKARSIANGISNLAGLVVGNIITEGALSESGLSVGAIKRISAYSTFGIPSIDANLKDSYNFIQDDGERAAFVTLGALINGEGGALLDLGKVSRVPGLADDFKLLSKNLVEKNLTKDAVDELLNKSGKKYIDYVMKYGKVGADITKETLKGAATMAYFTFGNEYNKLLNGDPNTQVEDLLPHSANAFMDGVLTMIPFGFVSGVKNSNSNKNSSYKEMINKLATFPDAAQDVFRLGSKSQQEYDYKMQTLNTARAAKNALDAAELDTGISLTPGQRSVYVANKTIEASLRDKANNTENPELKEQYIRDADELSQQSVKTMDGLRFSPTLEPLYDLYDAEKKYNNEYEQFHAGNVKEDAALLEAKNNYEQLTYKYFTENKPPASEQVIINGNVTSMGHLKEILAKGKVEVDKYDIEYNGTNEDVHNQLKAFGALVEDNIAISPKSREVINTEGASDLYDQLEGKIDGHYLDPLNKEGSVVELTNQALTAPGAIHSALKYNDKLTLELIARNTTEDINKHIDKWADSIKGENTTPQETKDADRHIRLLEKALEYKSTIHKDSADSFTIIKDEDTGNALDKVKGFIAAKNQDVLPEDFSDRVEQVSSTLDAGKRWSDGERIFALSEQDGELSEVKSLEQLNSNTADQLFAYPNTHNFAHIDSVVDRIGKSEPVNEKELNKAQDVLYDTLEKHPEGANLIEPLILKLQDYEHTTETKTRTVTEEVPIEGAAGFKRKRKEIKPALEQSEGSAVTVTLPDSSVRKGKLAIKSGQYVVDIANGRQVVIGEKAITDRDLKLPEEDKFADPIEFDEDGNVASVTFETRNGNLVKIEDAEKALDLAIQLQAEVVGEIPNAAFEKVFNTIQKEIDVEVEKPKVAGEHDGVKVFSTKNTQEFHDAISKAMSGRNADRFQADVHPIEYYQEIVDTGGKLFLSQDGNFGGFVQANGYMGSLFKNPQADSKGVAKTLQQIRVKNGGRFFDAYGTHLEDIYINNGFRPVARLKFNEEYAPEGWQDSNLKDKPDVVFFAYDPKGTYKKGEGKYFDDWDKAYIFAKDFNSKEYETAVNTAGADGIIKEVISGSEDVSKEGNSFNGADNSGYNEGQGSEQGAGDKYSEPAHINNSLTTQEFFSNTVNGANQPKVTWKPLLSIEGALKKVYDTWQRFRGGFDAHIETNIPAFRDVQIRKINAIAETLPDGGLVIDLGGSEGGFGKTLTELNPKIKTVNLDMNPDMEAAHNRNPVEGAEFVKAAFGEDVPLDDGTVVNRHQPKEKADVVHESMMFQFIMPERKSFIDEIADHYVKEDGVVILEEKVKAENWSANELKKDTEFKSDYYDNEAVKKKNEEVVVGMKGNQAEEADLIQDLASRFDYVYQYWDSGNFKGYIASNNAAKAKQMVDAIGDTTTKYTSREKLLAVEEGIITNQPDYLSGSEISATEKPSAKVSVKELDRLVNNTPDTGRFAEYMSKDTIEKYTGETPTNDQRRGVQELDIALAHGEQIIDTAKKIFGKDYVDKTLDYIENSTASVSNKAKMYVSLENALGKEKILNPSRSADITKEQALVYSKSQLFAREISLGLNYQRLRKIAQVGYDMSKVTDSFFSGEELIDKVEVEKSIEASPERINEEAELQETAGITPDIEAKIKEGVEKEINKIYEKLPKEKRTAADRAISALENVQKQLRSKTYDATVGIPVAIIDAGISTIKMAIKAGVKIADAIELGIQKIKGAYGKPWDKEDEFRKDVSAAFASMFKVKEITKDALIKKGFGREITVKGEKKKIIDWKKLAGAAGTVSKISEHVADALKDSKLSDKEITDAKDEFINEYIRLRTSVIEHALTELKRRNKENITPEQKSAAKKLAELYTYGLFEEKEIEFENTLNKALGVRVSEQGYNEAKKIAEAMETIYSSSFKGVSLNDISAKAAINKLEDKLRILLFNEAKHQGNFALRAANLVRGYFDIQQTMILNNLKQTIENPLSGLQQNIIDKIGVIASGENTSALVNQRRKLMKDVYTDMLINGGIRYGKTESTFVNRTHIDDYINKLSDDKIYHGIASVVTGKATLNAMDAMYKAGITEKKFASNLIKILTHDTNPKKMAKADAVKFVSEKLTGQTFKDAQVTAKQVIEKINRDANEELLPLTNQSIDRLANDIVKSALEMGDKVTAEQITAAYNAAYKSAGLGLGHEANNFLSSQVTGYTQKLEGKINQALKNKEWNRAAMLTGQSIVFRNILNPFVGGGTNWLVLKLEKTGLGLFTGLGYKLASNTGIDLTTELGMQKLEQRLYNQARIKDSYMRGLIGGLASSLTYLAFYGVANTDDYRKWRGKNMWATRYLDIITPEYLLAQMAVENKKIKKYAATSFNRNDAFDATTKIIKAADFAINGEAQKAWGAFGEAVGSKINAPIPWRLAKDGQVLYQGITGQDPYHGDYKPSEGFLNGVFQGGAIEWLGVRPPKTK